MQNFSNSPDVYHNIKNEDPFLEALASGGFQIEEYARLHYPNGILVDATYEDNDYQDLADQTNELLKQENVVIYEAAFYVNDLFIRTDVLIKKVIRLNLLKLRQNQCHVLKTNMFRRIELSSEKYDEV